MTKMVRPMTLGNGTIYEVALDADKITDFDVMGDMLTIEHEYQTHLHFPDKSEKEILQEFVFAWDKALNPPIKVTQAVLDAMEKVPEAKFWVWDDENRYQLNRPSNTYVSLIDSWNNGSDSVDDDDYENTPSYSKLEIGDYVQADCPLALQVLLQFNTEGEGMKNKSMKLWRFGEENVGVLATEEVISKLPSDARFRTYYGDEVVKRRGCWGYIPTFNGDFYRLTSSNIIYAEDTKALDYLSQFTTKGELIDV